MLAVADISGSILRHQFRLKPSSLGHVSFSWNVSDAPSGANASISKLEDVSVRVVPDNLASVTFAAYYDFGELTPFIS